MVRNETNMDVIAGNYVTVDEANQLVDRVTQLQTKSPEELRKMYRERLRSSPDERSKGASSVLSKSHAAHPSYSCGTGA